jgi:hypothetical protein
MPCGRTGPSRGLEFSPKRPPEARTECMERKLGVVSGMRARDCGQRASSAMRGSKRLCQKVYPVKNRVPDIGACCRKRILWPEQPLKEAGPFEYFFCGGLAESRVSAPFFPKKNGVHCSPQSHRDRRNILAVRLRPFAKPVRPPESIRAWPAF